MYTVINVPTCLTLALRIAVSRPAIFIIFAFLVSLGYGNAQIKQNDLKGNVKQIGEFHFEVAEKSGPIAKGEHPDASAEDGGILFSVFDDRIIFFNEKGKIIEMNTYDPDGFVRYNETYKYDEKGNIIENNWTVPYNLINQKWIYKYDNKGNKIESNEYNSDESLKEKTTYKYDNKGNKIEVNKYNSEGRLDKNYTYEYQYDKHGNWVKKIEYRNTIPKFITERKIAYY